MGVLQKSYISCCIWGVYMSGAFFPSNTVPKATASFDASKFSVYFLVILQHFNSQGAPIKSHLLTEYPWSPRWESSQMAERILEFLVDECLNFKKFCNEAQL
ncbi:hypothetical protein CK203_019889 [Vitis vinifera]|uniref:BRISC and BRCA1-A complex member 2 n=1 Tax=Vitis vinifera TaxID=29760 RepID=A0A438J2Y3_VITVI|nr:hypothetical protein CK203_019889 [Vitis vinifera]